MPQAFLEDPIEAFKRCVYITPFWEDRFTEIVNMVGTDRVVFGSDWPHPEGLKDPITFVDELEGLRTRTSQDHGRQPDEAVQGRHAGPRVSEASPEGLLFASTTQAFLEKEASVTRVRELHEAGVPFEPDWWRRAAELGWTGLLVPEELGGGSVSGDGVADLAIVAEQIGKTVAPGPLYPVSTVLAGLVDAAETQHAATIEALISGETVASWAVYEPGKRGHRCADGHRTPTDSGFRIDGVKDRVEAGAQSGLLLVVAPRDEGAVRQFLVPTDASGVRVEPQQSIDLVKHYARVHFDGVEVDAPRGGRPRHRRADRPAEPDRPGAAVRRGGRHSADRFRLHRAWALDRHSFGRPLASYQALKHRFADMKMWLEACRATTRAAVAAIADRSPDADLSASIAKSYVGEMATEIIQDCVQMHGGIGVTWEHDLHLYLRRAALYRSMFGTPEEHNLRVYQLQEAGQQEPAPDDRDARSAPTEAESVDDFRRGRGLGWPRTCRRIDPANPPAADRDEERSGCAPANSKSGSTKADSPGSAFPASTAAWVWTTSIRRRSTTKACNYEMPMILNTPTFTICCATILDTGSEEQKRQHIVGRAAG